MNKNNSSKVKLDLKVRSNLELKVLFNYLNKLIENKQNLEKLL